MPLGGNALCYVYLTLAVVSFVVDWLVRAYPVQLDASKYRSNHTRFWSAHEGRRVLENNHAQRSTTPRPTVSPLYVYIRFPALNITSPDIIRYCIVHLNYDEQTNLVPLINRHRNICNH